MLVELKLIAYSVNHGMVEVVALNSGATSSIHVGDSFLFNIIDNGVSTSSGRINIQHCDIGLVEFHTPNSNRPLNQVIESIIVAASKLKNGTFHPIPCPDKEAAWIHDNALRTVRVTNRTCATCRNKRRIGGEGCAIFGKLPEKMIDRQRCVHQVYMDFQKNIIEDFWPRQAAVFCKQGDSQIHMHDQEQFNWLRRGQELTVTMGGCSLVLTF